MAEMVKCDGCGKSNTRDGLIAWLQTEWIGMDAGGYGEMPGPWHFCSWACAAAFAVNRCGFAINIYGDNPATAANDIYNALRKVL